MKKKETKERKIITILLTFTMFFTVLVPNSVIFVAAKSDASTENEAVVYSVASALSEDKQTSEVTLTMTPRENVEIQSVTLPDGTKQDFNNEVMTYVSHENKDIVFEVNYVKNQSEEYKTEKLTTTLKYTISGIEMVEPKADEEERPTKETFEGAVAGNKLLKNASAEVSEMTTLDISKGSIIITAATVSGNDKGGTAVTTVDPDGYIITGMGVGNTIMVAGAAVTTIVLDNMSSVTASTSPMRITGNSDVTLLLEGENILQTNKSDQAGLHVNQGSSLTIDSAEATGSKTGSLSAKCAASGRLGMGIGSDRTVVGNITILGGTIEAQGAVGIGGTAGSKITISGGNVTATGGPNGAGIGALTGSYPTIVITGNATVTATGGSSGAGIGGGSAGTETRGSIVISGDAKVTAIGGYEAAGIGLGKDGQKMDITISGNPIITAAGNSRGSGIGGGSGDMDGKISINGGTITTSGSAMAIGAGTNTSTGAGKTCNISIKDTTISGKFANYFLKGNNIKLENVKMSNVDSAIGGISATGTVEILNETALKLLGSIFSSLEMITIDNSSLTMGDDVTGSSIYAPAKGVNISNSIVDMKSGGWGSVINAKTDVTIEESTVKILHSRIAAPSAGIEAIGTINFIGSDVNIAFHESAAQPVLASAPNINVNGGSIVSNGYINGTTPAGTISIQKGYIELTNQTNGILSNGNINISGGYINLANGISTSKTLNIKAITGEGDGNTIIYTSKLYGFTSNIEQGIIFYNGSAVSKDQYKGFVYGDVTLSNMIEENGTKFTIPKKYTLYLQEAKNATLTVPVDTKLVNEGTILNARTVTIDGAYENAIDAMLMNYNLTLDKGTATGGEFKGSGTLTNAGDVQNEVYVSSVTLDGVSYNVSDAALSTILGTQSIIGEPNEKLVYARQGENTLSYNNIVGKSLNSEWKYINTDMEYFTLTYNGNYEGAAVSPSIIVGKGKITTQEAPARNRYTFDGWYRGTTSRSNVELGEKWNFDTDEITGATTLYAKWVQATDYSVYYNANGGSMPMGTPSTITDMTYESIVPIAIPMRDGFTFKGWSYGDVAVNTGASYGSLEKDDTIKQIELVAQWEINKYKVHFKFVSDNIPDAISAPEGVIVEHNKETGEPVFIAPANWTFTGWYLDEECTQKYDFTAPVKADMVLYGGWVYEEPTPPTTPSDPTEPTRPSTPDSEKSDPKTGDYRNINIIITLLAISCSVSLILVGKRKKWSDS